uniref:Uncharacterized protein n=1 Tax=Mola mola TaxID=94237 RepID=A0A3Q4BVB3_MOLML
IGSFVLSESLSSLVWLPLQLVSEQQESRPLLSPSIDDFLCETKCDGLSRPVTSNTAVLSSTLDLLDLSEPGDRRNSKDRKSPLSSLGKGQKNKPNSKNMDETELIQVEVEQTGPSMRTPERMSLDSVSVCLMNVCWCIYVYVMKCEQRWGSALLSRHQSLEEEFERAKAAVESDTEFWDKMQAEWEELARRNWLTENEQAQIPASVSPHEKGYYFHTDNPYKDVPNAFEEGLKKSRGGDLPNAVLLLEAAVLQDPHDSEAWQVLGTTQAENENEQAAIVSLQRCLELHPNNLPALMALAVSLTNTGMRNDACEALLRWLRHNPKYKQLLKCKPHLMGSPNSQRRMSHAPNFGRYESSLQPEVKDLFLEAVQNNSDNIDPDLQTGLGVLYNLSGEFNKAVEAFNTALSVRPEVGTTHTQGNSRAVVIPTLIRGRQTLKPFLLLLLSREAASNFLTALSLQRKSRSRQQSHQVMSGNIWAALRIALSMLDQPELFQAANIGDLDLLMRAFNLDI